MSGLEIITKTILDDAHAEAQAILTSARDDAARIFAEAEAQTLGDCAKIAEAGRISAADILARAEAETGMERRRALLAKKRELLDQVARDAREALLALPEGEYFGFLIRLACENAERGTGVMHLSARDLARLPVDFHEKLSVALPEGASLELAQDAHPIDGGFILRYGDIEQNCSLAAIFDVNLERIFDAAREALFA